MLQFLCLLVLCGLLTQNVQGNGFPMALTNLSPEMLQQLLSQRMNSQEWADHLQSLPLEDLVKNGIKQGSGGGGFLSGIPLVGGLVNNVVGGVLGLKIKEVSLLQLDIKFDKSEFRFIVTIPADVEVEVKCPLSLMGRIFHLKLHLDIQVGVRLVKHPETGHIKLTIENCRNNPGHLKIAVLEKFGPLFHLINKVVALVTSILDKTLPHLLQKELCPLANGLVQGVLDLLQGSMDEKMFHMFPGSFHLYEDSLQLVYEGQNPGGQSIMIPPDSHPLPSIPLDGSPMNMVLSSNYLESAFQALLPPRVFNLGGQSECAVLVHQIAAVVRKVSHIQAVQITTGTPSLSLSVGKIQLWQPIEIRVYTEHPAGAYGPLFTIRLNIVWLAHPSLDGGKLIFTLHSPRLENLSLVGSAAGNYDVQHLTGLILRAVSACLLPHQNQMLAEGIPVPLVQELGLTSQNIAAGKVRQLAPFLEHRDLAILI
ncbi:BPI fold-containing family B member 1 [Heteronotia binoei]|uniref:BPI fold-containing family B member 1 n=1 Tax=Heteronotia binoei TaxID=13085 RepID=UPI00292F6E8B|nr:BPI fold-containing family B member 1 [Heteronotia binoei]